MQPPVAPAPPVGTRKTRSLWGMRVYMLWMTYCAGIATGDRTRTYDLHHVKVLLDQLSYLRLGGYGQGWIRTIESKC